MSTGPAPGYHTSEDEKTLHKLGYAQELFRAMGGFQNFAISFTIISILAGCLTSYYIAFGQGGPIAVTWGWLLVGLMSTHRRACRWPRSLRRTRPPAVSTTGPRSSGQPGLGLVHGLVQPHRADRGDRGDRLRARDVRDRAPELLVRLPEHEGVHLPPYAVFLAAALIMNLMKVPITAMLNTISAYWHMIGVGVIVVVLAARPGRPPVARRTSSRRRSTRRASVAATTTGFELRLLSPATGLLMAQYTITGFDASAHVAEETHEASRSAAVGMYMSVVASVVFGFILLVAVTFAIPAPRRRIEPLHHPVELGGGDGPELGRSASLHLLSSRSSSA